MDDVTFDRMARALSAAPKRRAILNLVAGVALGRVAGLTGWDEAEAGNKKKGNQKNGKGKKHKKKKKKRDEPKGEPCGDEFCTQTQCCHLGQCVDKSLCCRGNSDCNPCERCDIGLCVPNAAKNGTACNGCLECVNGACGIPNDEFCEDGQQCRGGNGVCCATCVNDQCCPPGSACINPGPFNENSCCDIVRNQPCGDNGDGTYSECCSLFNERCDGSTCVPKETCEGDLRAAGECCQDGRPRCDDRCCAPGDECCGGECVGVRWDPEHCGACGNACHERTEACFEGQCHEICSLNQPPWQNPCDDGVAHWCCPDGSTQCCRLSGQPHCC